VIGVRERRIVRNGSNRIWLTGYMVVSEPTLGRSNLMNEAGEYLDLLGRCRLSSREEPGGLVGRDIIIVPPEHRELDESTARELLARFSENANLDRIGTQQKRALIDGAQTALSKLSRDEPDVALGEAEKTALEAIVIAQGVRPVVNFVAGRLDLADIDLGPWERFTRADAGIIEDVARSIGRINLDGRQIGTGFVVTDTQIMTNRHVLAAIAEKTGDGWEMHAGASISFSEDGQGDDGLKFRRDGISTSNARSATGVDFSQFDYAIIPVEKGWFRDLPAPLALEETRSNVMFDRPVYVLGYPGRPQPGTERFSLLKDLFQSEYGVKRYCPGTISAALGDIEADSRDTVFGHDCTTLGGNSGSPVIDLGDGSASVIGIHFAGARRIANYAHSMAALQNEFDNDKLDFK